MIERKLTDIIDDFEFIPSKLQRAFENQKFSPEVPLKSCWTNFSKLLLDEQFNAFWGNIGFFDKNRIKELFQQLEPVVLAVAMYFGMDYLFDTLHAEESITYNYNTILNLMPNVKRESESSSCSEDIILRNVYDTFRKQVVQATKNTTSFLDPAAVNPYQVIEQKSKYSDTRYHDQKHELISFFPEIPLYLHQALKSAGAESEKQIAFHSLLKLLPFLLMKADKYLPGHKNTMSGTWTVKFMYELDALISEYNKPEYAVLSYGQADDGFPELLMWFGVEDLFHLNRLSYALAKYYDFTDEKTLTKKQSRVIASFFSVLVYLPSVEIQDLLLKDVDACANAYLNPKQADEEDTLSLARLLSVGSIILPSVLCLFMRALYTNQGVLDVETIKQRINEFRNDKELLEKTVNTFIDSEKVWNDKNYYAQTVEYKCANHEGKRIKFSAVKRSRLSDKELLLLFTNHEKNRFKNDTITFSNKIRMGHWKVLGQPKKAQQYKCDEISYLLYLMQKVAEACQGPS